MLFKQGGRSMIDFIIVGILYLGVMFVAAFSLSFMVISITLSVASLVRRCFLRSHQPDLSLTG
jgi:phosphatidylglycerophosphate synthase